MNLKEEFLKTEALIKYLEEDDNQKMDFYELCYACIIEIFGEPKKTDFNSISEMAWWFAEKQNIIREIIKEYKK